MRTNIEFFIAEVIDVYNDTYTDKYPSQFYTVLVRTYNEVNSQQIYCRPADMNIKKIPLIGEHVFIFKGITQETSNDIVTTAWYYLTTLPLQSSLNHNSLPQTTKQVAAKATTTDINSVNPKSSKENIPENIPLGVTFKEQPNVTFLQPFEGDLLIEGRFGNSIRFGSSHGQVNESNRYTQNQVISWDGRPSRPIIILSNQQPQPTNNKTFSIENISNDYSSLYLTSGQEIKTLKLSKNLTKSNNFTGSEFIGAADRVILQAKTDNIILDAVTRVLLNTENVYLGSESGPHSPIPKGDILEEILMSIILAIKYGVVGTSGIAASPSTAAELRLDYAAAKLKSLQSNRFYIDKNNRNI